MLKGRYEEAQRNLLKLHTPEEAAIETAQIRAQMEVDKTLKSSWWTIATKPSYRKRALLAMGTTAGIQFSGILVINNYGPTVRSVYTRIKKELTEWQIYARLGFGTNLQLIYASAWLTLAWGAGCMSLIFVELVPRPKFIGFGLFSCMVCLSVEAALVATYAGSTNSAALKAAVAMFFIYVPFYEICLDGVQFIYVGELFPTHIRSKGMTLGCCAIALMNVMWLQVTPIAFE